MAHGRFRQADTDGHGDDATPDNEIRHTRFPLSSSLPQAGERDRVSLREFHVNNAGPSTAKKTGTRRRPFFGSLHYRFLQIT